MDFLVIIITRSITHTIQKPVKKRIIPATILPSLILVITPHIHAVMGMIARMTLTM